MRSGIYLKTQELWKQTQGWLFCFTHGLISLVYCVFGFFFFGFYCYLLIFVVVLLLILFLRQDLVYPRLILNSNCSWNQNWTFDSFVFSPPFPYTTPIQYWDYGIDLIYLAYVELRTEPRALCMPSKHSTNHVVSLVLKSYFIHKLEMWNVTFCHGTDSCSVPFCDMLHDHNGKQMTFFCALCCWTNIAILKASKPGFIEK